ncbi:MAG: hypothetical protein R3C99_10230 [Pirellulaceae bacterium]
MSASSKLTWYNLFSGKPSATVFGGCADAFGLPFNKMTLYDVLQIDVAPVPPIAVIPLKR